MFWIWLKLTHFCAYATVLGARHPLARPNLGLISSSHHWIGQLWICQPQLGEIWRRGMTYMFSAVVLTSLPSEHAAKDHPGWLSAHKSTLPFALTRSFLHSFVSSWSSVFLVGCLFLCVHFVCVHHAGVTSSSKSGHHQNNNRRHCCQPSHVEWIICECTICTTFGI